MRISFATCNFAPVLLGYPSHIVPCFLPAILYAEIHYRFPFFPFSRYYRKEPEILADAPHRVEPGRRLPILLLVKDAHRFPVYLDSIKIAVRDEQGKSKIFSFKKNLLIQRHWWYETLKLDTENLTGMCGVTVKFQYVVGGKPRTCINHNVPLSREKPLGIFLSTASLPGKQQGWLWGDLHCHSFLTEDFVEFGAPLDATRDAATASGLDFLAMTDHSYDLDDKPGSWTETDPGLRKWHSSRKEIATLNKNGPPILIPGEEVSTTNSKRKNVHTLLLNHPEFLSGSGDSAEKWGRKESEHSTRDLAEEANDGSIAIAAHPRVAFNLFQRVLLNRGRWEADDFKLEGLSGFQILNGRFDAEFESGLEYWINTLLGGQRKFIYAGNDAHGNFNRFRQIKVPMISLWDHTEQILGKCRTGVKMSKNVDLETLIAVLRQGKCVISNGPLIEMDATTNSSSITSGESIDCSNIEINLSCTSTAEFGRLIELAVILGDLDSQRERTVLRRRFEEETLEASEILRLQTSGIRGYVRAELSSSTRDEQRHFCYTNPIWINA